MKPRAAPRFNSSLLRLALLAAFCPAPAHAFDWGTLGASCEGVKLQNFSRYLEGAKAWEALQERTRSEIEVLSGQVCPEYLQSANGAAGLEAGKKLTLEAYIARHTSTFHHAGETTGQAREGEAYLTAQFDRINGIHASVGWDFASSTCGTTITAARKHYAAVAAKVQALAADTGKKCARLSEAIAAQGPAPKAAARAGPGSPVPSGTSPRSESRITGEIAPPRLSGGEPAAAAIPAPAEPSEASAQKEDTSVQTVASTVSSKPAKGGGLGASPAGAGRSPASLNAASPATSAALSNFEESGQAAFAGAGTGRSGRSEEYVVASLLAGSSPAGFRAPSELEELVVSTARLRNQEQARYHEESQPAPAASTASAETSVFELVHRAIRKRQLRGAL